MTPTDLGTRTIADLVGSHVDLAQRLFGDVPPARLTTFTEVLEETTHRSARLMEDE